MTNLVKTSIKYLIFALPAVALVVPSDMYFPFITGKAFLFRVAVELAFFLYLVLAIADQSYRPKWNALTITFSIFVGVILLADIFAVNPSKALWSNFERMEGFVTLAHLFLYYIVASSVLKTKKDWNAWMFSSVAISVYMIFFCFLQLSGEAAINQGGVRVDGALGNAAYLATYLLFHIFFVLYLWSSKEVEWKGIGTSVIVGGLGYSLYYLVRISHVGITHSTLGLIILSVALSVGIIGIVLRLSDNLRIKFGNSCAHASYALIISSYLVLIYHTATRGAILGLIGGITIGALYLILKEKQNKPVRNLGAGILVGVLVVVGGFYFLKSTSFIQNSPVLSRFASLSLDTKGQARNYVWPMAIKGFVERPVLGWGQEGFIYVFQKYYVPEMITQEPWFDRAHNSFLDWLVAGGVLGFLSYFFLYVFALIYIWRSKIFGSKEKAVLIGLIFAYAFQSVFIFDNLVSYIMFISLLAFVSARSNYVTEEETKDQSISMPVLAYCIAMSIITLWLVNSKAYAQNVTLIKALSPQQQGISQNMVLFKKVLEYNSFGSYEAREQLIRIADQAIAAPNVSNEDKLAFANIAVMEMENGIKENPLDVRVYLQLGDFLVTIGNPDQAISILEKAKNLSPKKQQIAFALARAYFVKGINEKNPKATAEAVSIIKEAYDLAPNLDSSRLPYISSLIIAGHIEDAVKIINEVEDPSPLVNTALIKTLVTSGHSVDAINLLKTAISINNQNVDAYTLLADVYLVLRDAKNTIATLESMALAIPSKKSEVEANIVITKERLK